MSLLSLTLSFVSIKTCLRHLPMVEKLEIFLTISDDDDGNFTKCCHGHVLYRRKQYSHVIVYVREQCCYMDSERVVSNDR